MLDTKPSDRRGKAVTAEKAPETPQRTESLEVSESLPEVHGNDPSQEQISSLAYQLWIERGSPHGSHDEDWHRAEAQLRGRQTLLKTPKAAKAGA